MWEWEWSVLSLKILSNARGVVIASKSTDIIGTKEYKYRKGPGFPYAHPCFFLKLFLSLHVKSR
jgi:hypothetical protein